MKEASRSHLVLIPSYKPGERVYETIQAARRFWNPVWVVVDARHRRHGRRVCPRGPGQIRVLKVIVLPRNGARAPPSCTASSSPRKPASRTVHDDGFRTRQHPSELIGEFMAASAAEPSLHGAGRSGVPTQARRICAVKGRRVSNWWANLETLWTGSEIPCSASGSTRSRPCAR